jgi:AP-3 complex subunit beta
LTRLFQQIAPPSYLPRLLPSLIRLLRTRSHSILYPSLSSLSVIAAENPVHPLKEACLLKTLFTPHLRLFYVQPTDPTQIALLKLDILISSSTEATLLPILRELDHYSKSGDPDIVKEAIRGIARCAMKCSTDKAIGKCAAILGRGVRSRNGICLTDYN